VALIDLVASAILSRAITFRHIDERNPASHVCLSRPTRHCVILLTDLAQTGSQVGEGRVGWPERSAFL